MRKQVAVVLTILFMAMFFVESVSLQSKKENLVIEVSSSEKDPVKIVSFKVGETKIQPKEKFTGADDWLKDLQIDFENISGKNAIHIEFALWFPRPEEQKGVAPLFFPIFRGDRSEAMRGASSGFEIKADSTDNKASVSLLQQDYEDIRFYLNKHNYPSRTEWVKVYLRAVVFDDGTVWESGSWYKIDPMNPKNLIKIEGDDNIALSSSSASDCVQVRHIYDDCIVVPGSGFRCNVRSAGISSYRNGDRELIEGFQHCFVVDSQGNQTNQ